jgi:rhodanese-related sulfurtransferase
MMKSIRERVSEFFKGNTVPAAITENSSLHELALQQPHVFDFIERKYGVKADIDDKPLSLREFSEKYGLPPAQILFMEVQLSVRAQRVQTLTAPEARSLMTKVPHLRLLDVRENWEVEICRLPKSQILSPQLLDEALNEWPKDTPVLLYCHFGIRSLDAAMFLADRGFTEVAILKGGIDAWSQEIDASLPRYENAWC